MIRPQEHNWIGNSKVEVIGILSVSFLCCLALFFLPNYFFETDFFPEQIWLFLVVFVDVGHVYSTIYRTYIDKQLVSKHQNLFFGLPVLLFALSVLLHSISSILFWRCLAYFAVYHFIRQQYGFLRIYSRKNTYSKFKHYIDSVTIYGVTILPIIYWHFSGNRKFNWFLKNDFFQFSTNEWILNSTILLIFLVLIIYFISEGFEVFKSQQINYQKNAIVIGTALSWFIGIVYYNSDFVFTLLNVVCHGVPYMTLVWIHGKKTHVVSNETNVLNLIYGKFSMLLFLLPIVFFAYIEKRFWDAFVWHEHNTSFIIFDSFNVSLSKNVLNIIVPLLALPQLFHYVIDGFIWKIKVDKFNWTNIL